MANDSIYGLGASIWTRDLSKALRIAPRIEAGQVWINEWGALSEEPEEGGAKHSGLGRLGGRRLLTTSPRSERFSSALD